MSRRRFLYTMGGAPLTEPIEVTPDFQPTGDRMPLFTDRFMEGDKAPDGTDIGSRQKRRDWMKATGSADHSDFTNHWQRAASERSAPIPGLRGDLRDAVLKLKGY